MELENTTPTADCDYGIFTDLQPTAPAGPARPGCCSPVPAWPARVPGAAAGRVVCSAPPTYEVRQKRAGQDFALASETIALVADGHGRGHAGTGGGSRVINALRRPAAFWEDVATKHDPIAHVQEYLRRTIPGDTINDGSTLALVRALKGEPVVETCVIGDSSIYAFKPDGSLLFKTAGQALANPELQRAAARRGIRLLDPAGYFHATSRDTFTTRQLPYLQLGTIPGTDRAERLGMYTALGHWGADGSTRLDPTPLVRRFRLSPTDAGPTKFVVMTDGAADMICAEDTKFLAAPEVGASEIVDLVEERLAQAWRYQAPGAHEAGPAEYVLPASQHDDISVAVWSVEYARPL